MKRVLAMIMTALMLLSLCACGTPAKNDDVYQIGIVQLMQHVALDQATQGFQDALKEKLGDKVTFDVKLASGETTNCTSIVTKFVNDGVDLIMANATPALQAAVAATGDIPILATSITEYGVALDI